MTFKEYYNKYLAKARLVGKNNEIKVANSTIKCDDDFLIILFEGLMIDSMDSGFKVIKRPSDIKSLVLKEGFNINSQYIYYFDEGVLRYIYAYDNFGVSYSFKETEKYAYIGEKASGYFYLRIEKETGDFKFCSIKDESIKLNDENCSGCSNLVVCRYSRVYSDYFCNYATYRGSLLGYNGFDNDIPNRLKSCDCKYNDNVLKTTCVGCRYYNHHKSRKNSLSSSGFLDEVEDFVMCDKLNECLADFIKNDSLRLPLERYSRRLPECVRDNLKEFNEHYDPDIKEFL